MEETQYQGFLFGVLLKHTRWGFVPVVLVAALIFGAGHSYQGDDRSSWDSLWTPVPMAFRNDVMVRASADARLPVITASAPYASRFAMQVRASLSAKYA